MDHSEPQVRAILDVLRDVLDDPGPRTMMCSADARALIDGAWNALHEVLVDSHSGAAVELLSALHRLADVDHALLAARKVEQSQIGHRLGDVLARLEAAPCSIDELVSMTPRLIADLGFDRAIISHVANGMWVSQAVFIAGDPEWARAINKVGQENPQRLVPGLFETDMVRRRQAVVVTNVQHEPRVHRPIADASRSRSYVAAPVISRARVIGLLHADRYLQGRDTDDVDREVLLAFSHGLRLALSRAAVVGQLQTTRDALTSAAADADVSLGAVHHASLHVTSSSGNQTFDGREHPDAPEPVQAVLTSREIEVLQLMARGRTNAGVAATLVISEGTVKQHVKHILRKLRVNNRAEAVSRLYESTDR